MEELDAADMRAIAGSLFAALGAPLLEQLVGFVRALQAALARREFGAAGGPWDFNLRDVFRWCELMLAEQAPAVAPASHNDHSSYCYCSLTSHR